MKIEFHIDKLDGFLQSIGNQLGVDIVNNRFQIPADQGDGCFIQMQLSEDILITCYELLLNEQTTIVRKKSNNDNIIPIIFWLSDSGVKQALNSINKEIGKGTPNGIFLPANAIETKYTFPKNVLVRNVTVFIHKQWLQENINRKDDYLNNVILSSKNYFLFEEISYDMNEALLQIEDALKNNINHTLARINLYANTLRLINLLFDKVLIRSKDRQMVNITPRDIQHLFKVKSILLREYISIPSTEYLAKQCGMNKRKLQRLFKQVFGKSIYQFAVSVKMSEAKKMLRTKKYTVSEVGFNVGYTNLSHFTEKFKEYYNITPKTFLKKL